MVVLTMADEEHHICKHAFKTPFVCGARNLGEALRRISEGAVMIRTKVRAICVVCFLIAFQKSNVLALQQTFKSATIVKRIINKRAYKLSRISLYYKIFFAKIKRNINLNEPS